MVQDAKTPEAKTPERISVYEKLRHRNIRKNNARLCAIGLDKSYTLKPLPTIKKKTTSSSVPKKRNPSRVAKGTNSKSCCLRNTRVRRDVKKDSSWNDKEGQEEEEEVTKTARKPCPRNDATQSDDEEEEEDDNEEEKEKIKEGVARKNPLSADSDDTGLYRRGQHRNRSR
jgi:hypothetical protein